MVLHKFGDRLYNGLVSTITRHLQAVAVGIESTQDEQFLQEINQRWNDHNKSMQMIRDILMVGPNRVFCTLAGGWRSCRGQC